ncbi:MAG: hypothetical protein RIC18_09530 [Hoeflea sp.]|uniref:hypothetical protein n=1 Tax=Hoeflea sp. TaxID=1940281 RepID=UPI0032EB8BD2
MTAEQGDIAADAVIDKANRFNRLSALVMVIGVAAVLFVQRADLVLTFLAYIGVSVWSLCFVRSHGILVRPVPLKRQNLAAFVAFSTLGFLVTLVAAPELVELFGTVVFILIAVIFAVHVLYDGLFRGGRRILPFRRPGR